jgi:hypothetical protein
VQVRGNLAQRRPIKKRAAAEKNLGSLADTPLTRAKKSIAIASLEEFLA